MRRTVIAAVYLVSAIALIGCGGDAQIKVINNTSRYVSGDVDGDTFGTVPGGSTMRQVGAGGFLKSSSTVPINYHVHASSDGASGVVYRKSDKIRVEADKLYTYEIYYYSTISGVDEFGLREIEVEQKGGLVGP